MHTAFLTVFAVIVLGVGYVPAAEPELGTLEGTVTLDGQPLTDATIAFHTPDGQFVGAKIKDGKYKVDRVPAGKVTVTVESKKFPLPARYSDADKSALAVEVKAGKNALDVNLASK